jgi:hypothetical protein
VDASNGEVVVEAGKKITPRMANKLAKDGLSGKTGYPLNKKANK